MIPTTKEVKLSQADRFIIGFKDLVNECGLTNIIYNQFGIKDYIFEDGSNLHWRKLFTDIGFDLPDALNSNYPKID